MIPTCGSPRTGIPVVNPGSVRGVGPQRRAWQRAGFPGLLVPALDWRGGLVRWRTWSMPLTTSSTGLLSAPRSGGMQAAAVDRSVSLRVQSRLSCSDARQIPLIVTQKREPEAGPQQPPTAAGDLWEDDVDEPVGEVTTASENVEVLAELVSDPPQWSPSGWGAGSGRRLGGGAVSSARRPTAVRTPAASTTSTPTAAPRPPTPRTGTALGGGGRGRRRPGGRGRWRRPPRGRQEPVARRRAIRPVAQERFGALHQRLRLPAALSADAAGSRAALLAAVGDAVFHHSLTAVALPHARHHAARRACLLFCCHETLLMFGTPDS